MIRNMKLKNKLVFMNALTCILFIFISLIFLFLMRDIQKKGQAISASNEYTKNLIQRITANVLNDQILVREAAIVDDNGLIEINNKMNESDATYNALWDELEAGIRYSNEKGQLEKIDAVAVRLDAARGDVMQIIKSGSDTSYKKASISNAIMTWYVPVADEFSASWNDFTQIQADNSTKAMEALNTRSIRMIILSVVFLVILFIISILLNARTAKTIVNRLLLSMDRIALLAKGDLHTPAPMVDTKEESGMLADATATIVNTLSSVITDIKYFMSSMADGKLNVKSKNIAAYEGDFEEILIAMRKMRGSMSDVMKEVTISSEQVDQGSEQVSSSSQILSQGSTEQAASIEELSALIADISEHISKDTDSAKNAATQNSVVLEAVNNNNELMGQMSVAMTQISDRSGEISKIIKTINDIAFQTNILALNAAVEAARAGEAGKGFAVVADEVRNLAGKSAEAANNTEALIAESISAVNNGVAISERTAESVNQIVDATQKVDVLLKDIVKNTTTQFESIQRINTGVQQISSVVQSNAATSEETAAASEELAAQAERLKSMLKKFTLSNEELSDTSSVSEDTVEESKVVEAKPKNRTEKKIEKKVEIKKPTQVVKKNTDIKPMATKPTLAATKATNTAGINKTQAKPDSSEEKTNKVSDDTYSLEPFVYSPSDDEVKPTTKKVAVTAPKPSIKKAPTPAPVASKPTVTMPKYTVKMDDFGDIDPKY